MQKWAKKMNKKKDENESLVIIAKVIIAVVAIVHLIFANIHVKAMLLLENEICGFVMFLFVLFGLIALFESTRIKKDYLKEWLITAVITFITVGFGGYLISIYQYAIANQKSLETRLVSKAVVFSAILIAVYIVAGMLLLIDFVKRLSKEKA